MMTREVELPSSAILKVGVAPFAIAKALYQAILAELKSIPIDTKGEVGTVIQRMFCVGFSSPVIEARLEECFKSCLYDARDGGGALRITDQTFEPVERRQDYMKVCVEVAKENVGPFVKSLYADFKTAISTIEKLQE